MKTKTIKDFLELNRYTESYVSIKENEEYFNPFTEKPKPINLDTQPRFILDAAKIDLEILRKSVEAFNKRKDIRPGDFINLPSGQYVIIGYINDDTVQTYTNDSLYLGDSGHISYSGILDTGIKKKYLIMTDEKKVNQVWFFHEGYAGGGRGVYANIEFRVYKTHEGADLSGIPQAAN